MVVPSACGWVRWGPSAACLGLRVWVCYVVSVGGLKNDRRIVKVTQNLRVRTRSGDVITLIQHYRIYSVTVGHVWTRYRNSM